LEHNKEENYRVEEYYDSKVATSETIRDKDTCKKLIEVVCDFNYNKELKQIGEKMFDGGLSWETRVFKFDVLTKHRERRDKDGWKLEHPNSTFKDILEVVDILSKNADIVYDELRALLPKEDKARRDIEIVMAHGDMNYFNFLIGEETGKIKLIDYTTATLNYRAADLS